MTSALLASLWAGLCSRICSWPLPNFIRFMLGWKSKSHSGSSQSGYAPQRSLQDDVERQLAPEQESLPSRTNPQPTEPGDYTTILEWSPVIPELSLKFYVDTFHLHYLLYREARTALQEELSPSAMTCVSLSELKSLSKWPPSFGKLINLLADKYCVQDLSEDQLDFTPNRNFTLDFLVYGMLEVARRRLKSTTTVDRPDGESPHADCHTLCMLRRRQSSTSKDRDEDMALFLDTISALWVDECAMRCRAEWSPMPWSQISQKDQMSASSYPNDLIVDVSLPKGEILDDNHCTFLLRQSAFGIPMDVPWWGAPHDGYPFSPTLTGYVKLRLNGWPRTANDDLALWIHAMTFGLLEAVFSVKVAEIELRAIQERTGEPVLSGSSISRLIFKGEQYWLRRRDDSVFLERGRGAADVLKHALMAIGEECRSGFSMGERAGLEHAKIHEIICAVTLTTTALCRCAASLWGASIPQIDPLLSHTEASHSSTYLIVSLACMRRLISAGWCPNMASLPFLTTLSRPALSNILHLSPFVPACGNSHRGCTDKACAFYFFTGDSTPPTLHTTSTCPCDPLKPPDGEVERLLSNRTIPVLTYDGGRLYVHSAESISYVAISHVWAEGLGSTTEVGLPTCQVARLASLCKRLLPDSGGAFWIDSLCVPAMRDLRKRAIKLMAETYARAASVLVIDASIRQLCTRTQPWITNILRIATSAWVRRVWTLQEGLLAQRLVFEFADDLVDGVELETHGCFSSGFYDTFLPLLAARHQHGRAAPVIRLSDPPPGGTRQGHSENGLYRYTLDEVIGLLRLRTTSHLEDEPVAVAGLLPAIDVDALFDIRVPEERLATFHRQIQRLPRRFPMLPVKKLDLPGYRWAPHGIGAALENSMGDFGYATCDEDGLHGKYAVARLQEPIAIPLEGQQASSVFVHRIVHEQTMSAHHASFIMECVPASFVRQLTTIDALLFYEDGRFSREQVWTAFAAVHTRPTGDSEEGQTDAKPLRCDFVAPGTIQRLAVYKRDGAAVFSGLDMQDVLLR